MGISVESKFIFVWLQKLWKNGVEDFIVVVTWSTKIFHLFDMN